MKSFEQLKQIDSALEAETGLHFRQIPVFLKIKRKNGWRYLYSVKKGRIRTAWTVGGATVYNGVSDVLDQHIDFLNSKKVEFKIIVYSEPVDITKKYLNF